MTIKLLMAILSLQSLPADSKICVATEENRYLCTDRHTTKASIYPEFNTHQNFNVGVEQRVDGSDEERAAVEEVLRLMHEYLDNEVLVKPEYGPVLDSCENTKELCAFWVSVGECDANRGFMLDNCAASCRLCLLLHSK